MIQVETSWHQGLPVKPVLKQPRHLVIRHERRPNRFLISDKPLKAWLDRKGLSFKQVMDDLEGTVVMQRRRLATLGAGTDIPGITATSDQAALAQYQAQVAAQNANTGALGGLAAPARLAPSQA